MIDKKRLEDILSSIGASLKSPQVICVVGSSAALLNGQPDRQTQDIDLWGPQSDFDTSDLKMACEQAGLLFDPVEEISSDQIYIQVMRPGVTLFPREFPVDNVSRYGNLKVVMPAPELIVATKLARATERDIEDAAWWFRSRNLDLASIEASIMLIPLPEYREAALENMILLDISDLAMKP